MSSARGPALLIFLLLAGGCQGAGLRSECAAGDRVTVQVVRHRWHTGIVIPAGGTVPALAFLDGRFPAAESLEIGWGDARFYREPDSTWLMIRALFWPTDTVLHLVGLQKPPQALPHGDLVALSLPRERLRELQRAIAADFRRPAGEPEPLAPGLYGDSSFYRARGRFWFANTCNSWTARRLARAEVPIRTWLTLTADSVMEQVREARQRDPCLVPGNNKASE